jgi:hypothetical protein
MLGVETPRAQQSHRSLRPEHKRIAVIVRTSDNCYHSTGAVELGHWRCVAGLWSRSAPGRGRRGADHNRQRVRGRPARGPAHAPRLDRRKRVPLSAHSAPRPSRRPNLALVPAPTLHAHFTAFAHFSTFGQRAILNGAASIFAAQAAPWHSVAGLKLEAAGPRRSTPPLRTGLFEDQLATLREDAPAG